LYNPTLQLQLTMKKESINKQFVKGPEYIKNEVRFKLLVTLLNFQNDIKAIRDEFNIPPDGFSDDKTSGEWYENEIIEKTDKIISSQKFRKAKEELATLRDHAEYLKREWELNDKIPLFKMRHRKEMLGKKYRLPANFYEDEYIGLSAYIIRNDVIPPINNWLIQHDSYPHDEKGTAKWLAIKTYAPLSQKEVKDAMDWLTSLQKHYFPKEIIIDSRIKKQFDRDLSIFKELALERDKKPTKRKIYSGYLSFLKDSGERKKWEKLHPNCIDIGFDATTSREVARRFDITSDAVRQAIKRMSTLIKNLFGDEFIIRH